MDGELSELEQVALDSHLTACAACRAYGLSVADATARLRSAPLEQPAFPVVLPHRSPIRVPLRAVQAAAVAVVVAGLGFSAAGLTPTGERSASLSVSSEVADRSSDISRERVARATLDFRFSGAVPPTRRGRIIAL
jgi:anti-sigma factor RsiW